MQIGGLSNWLHVTVWLQDTQPDVHRRYCKSTISMWEFSVTVSRLHVSWELRFHLGAFCHWSTDVQEVQQTATQVQSWDHGMPYCLSPIAPLTTSTEQKQEPLCLYWEDVSRLHLEVSVSPCGLWYATVATDLVIGQQIYSLPLLLPPWGEYIFLPRWCWALPRDLMWP